MAGELYQRYIPPAKSSKLEARPKSDDDSPAKPKEHVREWSKVEDKPRKEKRKRKLKELEEPGSEEEYSKRHHGVMSKFQKSAKIAEAVRQTKPEVAVDEQPSAEEQELHDLGPLPQPEQPPELDYRPDFSSLPKWLANPAKIGSETQETFASLGIKGRLLQRLEKLGYAKAFAVQCGLIPLLLPGQSQRHHGDICVSAATGSGKTLAYLLPIIQSLDMTLQTKLRAVIIVPTRELVSQVRQTAEDCVVGTRLKVGVAVGSQSFADEQRALVRKTSSYNPEGARARKQQFEVKKATGAVDLRDYVEDEPELLPDHVLRLESKVDILVCTPGRLVEHLNATAGFSLLDLQWLVIDEADRLLDQSFQDWAKVLTAHVHTDRRTSRSSKLERFLPEYMGGLVVERESVTKVILSATMTRDSTKLAPLRLQRPKLLVVQGAPTADTPVDVVAGEEDSYSVPVNLEEYAVPVGDGSEKPLFLLELLHTRIIPTSNIEKDSSETFDESSSEDDSSSSTDTSSSSDSDSDTELKPKRQTASHNDRWKADKKTLIFTNNNENAERLHHVLCLLQPNLRKYAATLTKSSASSSGKRVLAAFKSGKAPIMIASDRASRGLDVPDLTHIINYDIPRSVVSYVHRVGRTARAGRTGEAWTFFTGTEAKWFWNTVAKGPQIDRNSKMVTRAKLNLSVIGDDTKRKYEDVLQQLREAVEGVNTIK